VVGLRAGADAGTVRRRLAHAHGVHVGAVTTLPGADAVTVALRPGEAPAAVAALTAVLRTTPLGRRIRAVVQNRDLAAVSGLATGRVDRLTFFIGSGLAGIAGVALTLLGSTGPTLGTSYIVDAFLVVVAGGIGQIKGAVIAAFGLGMLQATFEYSTTASIAKVMVFVVIVVFLQIRPQGIFSVRARSLA
jgi:urea transport system permease protein